MNALVAGATGLVGRELVSQLISSGKYQNIILLVRKTGLHKNSSVKELLFDYKSPQSIEEKVDDVFVCLGTTIKKAGSQKAFRQVDYDYVMTAAQLAVKLEARSLQVISSMGASSNSSNFYLRVKGEMENGLMQHKIDSITIVRPSLILGKREEFRLGERIGILIMKPLMVLMRGALLKYKPIEATNIARVMLWSAQNRHKGARIIENDGLYSILDNLS